MHRTIFCQITSTWFLSQKSYIEPCLNESTKVSFGRHSRKINSWGNNTEDIQGTSCSEMATPPASGTIRSRLCASWGPERPLRGTNGVAAEIVVTLGCEICYWLQPGTGQTTNTWDKKMQAMCLLEPLGALIGTYGQIPWDSQIQNFFWIIWILLFRSFDRVFCLYYNITRGKPGLCPGL